MQTDKEKALRLAISAVFAILIFLPLVFVCSDLARLATLKYEHQLTTLEQQLKVELGSFRENLIPRFYLENLIKASETHIGLTAETHQRPVFARGVDPQLITANTISQLRQFYKDKAGIEPLMVLAFGVDYEKIWSWFRDDFPNLVSDEKSRIEILLACFASNFQAFTPVIAGNSFDVRLKELISDDGRELQRFYRDIFYDYFSDMTYVPLHQGSAYDMAIKRYNSRLLFAYNRVIKDGNMVFGGYFVVFTSNQLKIANLLAAARVPLNQTFVRSYPAQTEGAINQIQVVDDYMFLSSLIPTELAGYNTLAPVPQKLPRYMAVSAPIHDLKGNYRRTLCLLASVVRLVVLAILAMSVYFVLFGFPPVFRLRARMLAAMAIVLLLPYVILGYFCLTILDNIQGLSEHELRVEANGLMYRLQSYYTDQKLQIMLQLLKAKARLIKSVDDDPDSIMRLPSHDILPPASLIDLNFFRDDGITRGIHNRHRESTDSSSVYSYMSVKYLDNLGVLDKQRSKVRSLLEQSMFADGMMESIRQNYAEHYSLVNEAFETKDLAKMDDFSRMFYYLIPTVKRPGNPVRVLVMSNVNDSDYILIKPYEFLPGMFSQTTTLGQHEFAMGQRRIDDMILRWWPISISLDSRIKRLLLIAAGNRENGFQSEQKNQISTYQQYRFNKNEPIVFAGISTASPDQLLKFFVQGFPFLLLVIALISLFLSGDILAALFIAPVRGFHKATRQIGAGNYQLAVNIEKTDEFSLLADSFNRMALGLAQREKMRRFVSENLYEQLGSQITDTAPRVSQVTLLASDIRSFTTLSEKYEPQQIVSLLNDYFTEMETAITSCGGFIERLVGDAVVAVFYQEATNSSEQRAAQAALRMRARLVRLNQERAESGLFTIENGIGIATGQAFSGMAGEESGRRVFSVIGEVARLAEKLEAASRFVNSRILLCPQSAAALDKNFKVITASEKCDFVALELVSCEVDHV
ncbi:MAG: HAMP domain-containing protein [Candidatus Riflebacteria bacterium]|nr:HAMP domain-containing protein [Candidatus Riflebacteria bacterium]